MLGRTRLTLTLLTLAPLHLGACGDARPADSRRGLLIDSVGTRVHIHNTRERRGVAQSYRLRELWRRGGPADTGIAQFTGPELGLALGPDGVIALLDMDQEAVSLFHGATGEAIGKVGRPGRGPGEYRRPAGIAWDPAGHLWVANAYDGRYNIYDDEGQFVDTYQAHQRGINLWPLPMAFVGNGRFRDHRSRWPLLHLLWIDPGTGTTDSATVVAPDIGPLTGIAPADSGILDVLWLRRRQKWDFERGTSHTWLARSDSLLLFKVDQKGDTVLRVTSEHRQAAFTASQREAVDHANRDLGRDGGFVPVVALAIHTLQDGRLLLQISEGDGQRSSTFDVFSHEGAWLGTLRTPLPVNVFSRLESSGDTIILPMLGGMDVPVVAKALLEEVGPLLDAR